MNRTRTIRHLWIFSLVALGIGWLGVGLDSQLPDQQKEETLGMAVWLITPLLLVIFLRTFFGDGWKDAGLHPRLSSQWKWYVIAFLIFPVVTLFTMGVGALSGWVDFTPFDAGAYFSTFVILLGINLLKNVFEESVWRGYLTVKLIGLNMGDLGIYLIAGLLWGLWHLPYYLEFLPEEAMYTVLPVSEGLFAAIAVVNMLVWTVMFTEIFRLTGSVWSVVLLHAVEDAVINHLVIDGFVVLQPGTEIILSPICGILPTLLYLLIGLWLRTMRMRQESRKANPLN
ncbi:MAG: CPBP family intramembrane metalloprotease [Lunatimonas sp.]|uniref:CPBP family intramembrane glutamic endopeptidase n=1 Tax=Lunatimonas sp. TaxID=2060141 RepID=UPI00263B93F1|nr:CPBP family intramembrane glutamic endopeptidase [Lunatimonas sp.]MCC5936593.1 CPBP family intramembrane metalloprotease [Lunatimonas sp.]